MNSATVKKYASALSKGLSLAVFFLFFIKIISAQNQFKNYGVSDGLPSSAVYCVMQDSKGYMWFGTDEGVCRFNGYEFKIFNTSNGLPDNDVFEIKEDYKGRLWFRTLTGRLSYYYNDSIYNLRFNDKLVAILKNARVISLAIDSSDNVYMGLHGYIYPLKIDLKTGNISFVKIEVDEPSCYVCYTPDNGVINGLYGKNDQLSSPDYTDLKPELNILKINSAGRVISKTVEVTPVSNDAMHDKAIILPDGNMISSTASVFSVRDAQGNILFSKKFPNLVLSVVPGIKNDAWLIVMGNSPWHYSNGKLIQEPAFESLSTKFITGFAADAEGGFWFSTLGNGVYYARSLGYKIWTSANGLQSNKINALKVGPDSTLWVAAVTSNKIALLHNDSVTWCNSLPDIPGITVNDILFHPGNNIWMSTTKGTYVLNNQKPFEVQHKLESNYGYKMLLNNDSSVWCSGVSCLNLLKVAGNKVIIDKRLPFDSRISCICKGQNDNELWVGQINDLLLYSNGVFTSLGKENPLFKIPIIDLFRTSDNLWVATYNGIIIKNAKGLRTITVNDGLISNFCRCLCPDNKGNIWVGTRNGVSEIIVDKNARELKIRKIRNFHLPSLNEVNALTCFGNMVYVGTNSGLTAFDMTKVLPDTVQPPIYITGIKINDRYHKNTGEQNQFKYDENYMVFNYTGLTYTNAGNVNYRYKMQGIDTAWQYTKNTSVQYPRLQPGNYTFLVSAMNEDGVWNQHPASFSFVISPPFWATWWARTIMVLFVAAIVYWQFRELKIRERRKAEISKLMTTSELRELKKQVDPHFLFNSLNTLYNLVQSKPDIAPEFVDKLAKFYRYTLDNKDREFSDLGTEVEQGERYVKLLQIRFGKEFDIKWNIKQEHLEYFIPTFALQLLIENITKHNTILAENPIYVNIRSTEDNILVVENHIIPRSGKEPSTGIGLKSIEQRYKLLTSKQIKITHSTERFVVELPLISYEEYESINN